MGKVRVAIVAPSMEILGGQAVQAARLVEAWRGDPDVDAWLVPVNPRPPGLLRHARAVKYLRTIVTELTYLPLLAREIPRADVVHVFSASYTSFLLAPLPALVAARLLATPAMLNYRSGEAPGHLRRSRLARAVIARTSLNIVPSQYLVDVFGSFGLAAEIVPNVVDTGRFEFHARRPLRPRLLSTRNFEALYNVECTVRAFAIVQRAHPDATLTLVGGGRTEPGLRALARDLGLRGVTFTGRVAPADIPASYAANDIYVQSPNIDNAPTSVLEAFASGLPVVSTNAGGVPAILADGREGLLAPVGDHDALAARILDLLARPDLAESLATRARDACRKYTWDAVRGRWLRVYRKLASAVPEPAPACERVPGA
jgi:glycosyltransferase involved in cell wall biosynthesis